MSLNMNEWLITPEELSAALRGPKADRPVLLDVRNPDEHAEGHLDGCVLIPLSELSARAEDELETGSDIVVYCAHGVRSMQALLALRARGFERVRSLDGGIAAWDEWKASVS